MVVAVWYAFLFGLVFLLFFGVGLCFVVCLVVGWRVCFTSLHGSMLGFFGCGCECMLTLFCGVIIKDDSSLFSCNPSFFQLVSNCEYL